jgi:nuclear GTP-binding protein
MNLLSTESFADVFGKKAHRKRPKLTNVDVDGMINTIETATSNYDPAKDSNIKISADMREAGRHVMFNKGQSNRIWTELYKVIDCSDVVVQVLDARDPAGTRSAHIENYLKKHAKQKNLIFILNKCDLVPNWVTVWFLHYVVDSLL